MNPARLFSFVLILTLPLSGCGGRHEAFDAAVAATRGVERELARLAAAVTDPAKDPPVALLELRERAAIGPGDVGRGFARLLALDFDRAGRPTAATVRITVDVVAARGGRRQVVADYLATVAAGEDGPRLELEAVSVPDARERDGPAFQDATLEAGLADVHHAPDLDVENRLVRGIWPGSGAGAADVDGDGDVDLLVLDGRRSILYGNDGHARFTDRTADAGLEGLIGTGVAFADLDQDGDPDLLVTNAFGGNRLFENRAGVFVDRTEASGTATSPKGSSVAIADYDGDGRPDIYVCNSGDYYHRLPDPVWNARDGYPNALFRNLGDLRFEDRAAAAGVASTGWSLAAAFADYDGDGDQDLYVANDFGLNELYRNRGDGTFEDVTKAAGAGARGYGMSVTWGDYDGDGDEDLYVSNIESHYAFLLDQKGFPLPPMGRLFRFWVIPMMKTMLAGNSLLENQGNGTFVDVSEKRGVARGGWGWGALFLDYDGDGQLDIYAPNGFVTTDSGEDAELDFWIDSSARWSDYLAGRAVFDMAGRSLHGHERDVLFRGHGGGPFDEVGFLEGVDFEGDARGTVRADFDGDGRPDLYVRQVLQPGVLLMNRRAGGHRLALHLRTATGGPAIGAVVDLDLGGGRRLHRVVRASEGYFSSQDPTLLVGVGEAEAVVAIDVRWPSGRHDRHAHLPVDCRIDWTEGGTPESAPLADGS